MIKLVDEVTPLNLTEVGGKIALICIEDQTLSERVAEMIDMLGFHVIVAQKPSSTLNKLVDHHYDLIILDEKYGLSESSENPFLIHMQRLPMAARRRTFLCLLSGETSTLDQMAAFRTGTNLVINSHDVEKIPLILDRILKDYQIFYAVLNDELGRRVAFSI